MTQAWVLIDAVPTMRSEVTSFLGSLPKVTECRPIHYGHFNVLVKVDGPSHAEVQSFIVCTLRFARGIESVREIEDGELPSVLASAGS